jgi:polysaccharide biosynthesis protein PelC
MNTMKNHMIREMNTILTKKMKTNLAIIGTFTFIVLLTACASGGRRDMFRDPNMDFGSIKTVAIVPLANLTRDTLAADRVKDVLANNLYATGGVYVVPPGEVARGIARAGIAIPSSPSIEEVKKLGGILSVDAVITGVVKEYGEVRSGSVASNVISLSLQMVETQTGKVIWSASITKGGVSAWDRLVGGGGEPVDDVTERAVNDLIEKLF